MPSCYRSGLAFVDAVPGQRAATALRLVREHGCVQHHFLDRLNAVERYRPHTPWLSVSHLSAAACRGSVVARASHTCANVVRTDRKEVLAGKGSAWPRRMGCPYMAWILRRDCFEGTKQAVSLVRDTSCRAYAVIQTTLEPIAARMLLKASGAPEAMYEEMSTCVGITAPTAELTLSESGLASA